ncbi:predicted protein [Aspergillus terreus NIH2624]|uniref:Uncharacterized protein n=1 Tax=Aspergillus terreus (strain NIH 2624 / FGSC A1156) TaxID=341663 RepID=Q0C9Z7_ASPTN|nr:uncharacterized protein ATEG_09487 [Aspergillus terreus NIH2624]EAU29678.1 predicted protein [Aspergillus terreus NIH2624]
MKLRYGFGIPDLCGLLSALVPQPGNKFVEESMLAPPPEDEWRSAKSLNPGKMQTSTSSTKVMLFPGPHPQAHTKHMWMERHKPHGRRPVSTSKVAIWGSWSQNQTGWSCLIAFSNIEAATVYSDRLSSVLSGSNAQMVDKLTKHWVRACYYICRLGLNDASLRLVDISEAIDNLRYLNAATPKPGGALACLMYMNQLEYQKRLVDFLSASLGKFPTNWDIVQKPGWTKDMAKKCRLLSSNIDKVYEEASKLRNLVIEHYGLAQSRNLGFLTILASFFVPITAVSGFFGMNTTEINGGTWPTKYFGIVAGSLTFVSVLLPLVVLSLIDAVLRFLSQDILRHFFASVILLVALAANIHLVILYNADWSLGIQIWFAVGRLVMPVITVAQYVTIDLTLPIIRAIQVHRRRDQDLGSTAFSVAEAMKEAPLERKWRLAVFTVLTVVYFIGYFVNAHTSIVAMGLYYVYVGVAWYWHRRRSKRSME